jgi:hypothetical protein
VLLNPPIHAVTLKGSSFVDDLDHITSCFDKTTKLRFSKPDDPQYIKFGSTRDNDIPRNVRFGQLKLDGYVAPELSWKSTHPLTGTRSDVASFFQPSIDCVIQAIQEQIKHSPATISVGLSA